MSLIRKALWPTAIALSLVVFMALGGTTAQKAYADHGDLCGIGVVDDPNFIFDDDEELVTITVDEEGRFFVFAVIHPNAEDTTYGVNLDNAGGSAVIVGVLDGDEIQEVNATTELANLNSESEEDAEDALGVDIDPETFGDCGVDDGNDDVDEDDDQVQDQACDEIGDGNDFNDDCEIIAVEIECEEEGAGTFDVSFFDEEDDDDSISIEIDCRGASDDATLDVIPNKIEIVPAPANVAHSLARLELVDENGNAAFPGEEVLFTVDRCAIEASGVSDEAEFEEAEELFEDYSVNLPGVAIEIEEWAADDDVDGTEEEDNTESFTVTDDGDDERTIAAAVVHCDPEHAPGATPGVITVTAIVEQDGADDIYTAKITLVGPPATITVTASPTELRCGEKASIVVVVKDSIGQNVSDHTQVEAVTNAGGVLGGTGAVIGQAGPVVPISSTVSETFNGTTTFFLLTSEQHSGPYEVVVTTGGNNTTASTFLSGLFSTPAISAQTTVKCTIPVVAAAPAPAPTVKAPSTGDLGTGSIRPPSTGDAGLADASGTSWTLVGLGAVVAFGLAGAATVKVTRR